MRDTASTEEMKRMLQRFERVALPSGDRTVPAVAIDSIMPAAGSTLALPFGEIAGEFRASGRTDKRHRAIYELLIANNTAAPVATFAYALEGRLQTRITWDAIIVPAHSAVSIDIDVALPKSGLEPRMIAEVYTHDSKLVLDARPDARGIRRKVTRRAIATFAGLAVVLTGSLTYAAMRPHIDALAAPQTVQSGSSFQVAYSAQATSADYTVQTPDGAPIASGPLDARASSFSVALPPSTVSLGYDVRVNAHGPLGNDERTVHVIALAPQKSEIVSLKPHLAPVNVTHVAVESDTVDAGQPIVVTYRSTVPNGTVRLIDQYGTVRGEALLSGRGRATLVAPSVDADQDLRVVVTAERGNARAASAVPVTIHHVDSAAPDRLAAAGANVPALAPVTGAEAAAAPPASADDANANPEDAAVTSGQVAEPAVALPGPPISVEAKQTAGEPVRAHILRHDAGLRLAMMGPDGDELVSENVPSAATSVLLQAPTELSQSGKGYSIVATFSRGVAQETLIRSIAFVR